MRTDIFAIHADNMNPDSDPILVVGHSPTHVCIEIAGHGVLITPESTKETINALQEAIQLISNPTRKH